MNRCSTCARPAEPGLLFCEACGAALPAARDAIESAELPWQVVHVFVPAGSQQWRLALNGPLWIGRADPDQGFWPQVDLTDANAAELGVSRRHAVIDLTDQGPVLIDKNSANGTWIEEEQLLPLRPYVLQPLTRVRLGRLPLQLVLE